MLYEAFLKLKTALTSATCLALPQCDKTFQCVVDASATGVGGVLMQSNRPIAYLSKRLNNAERNYSTSDKQLLAAVICLKEWRIYLSSTPPSGKRNKLITDHLPNFTVLTKKDLSSRQCRWMEIVQKFPLTLMYEKGASNISDPLSRLPESKQAAVLSLNLFRNEAIQEFLGDTPNYSHIFDKYTCPEVIPVPSQNEDMSLDVPFPIFIEEDNAIDIPIVKTANFLNMSVLPMANTVLSHQAPLNFHHLSLLPMKDQRQS